jgi:hypothetical protein
VLKPRARKTVKPTETQQQPAPIDVATADGLEASGSLAVGSDVARIWAAISFSSRSSLCARSCVHPQDSEVLAAVAPQDAVEEELRLQHEREKQVGCVW